MAGEFATAFDGSGDYLARGEGLTGQANRKLFSISFWAKYPTISDVDYLFANQGDRLRVYTAASNGQLFFVASNTVGTIRLNSRTTSEWDDDAWHHFLCSVDLGNAKLNIYVDDSSDKTQTTLVDDTLNLARPDWGIGSEHDGSSKLQTALSELWFALEYVDFSITANRRKFISASLKPVPLGADGSGPTGTAAIIYAPDGNAVVNQGTGGNFVENGSPVRIVGPGDKPSPAAKIYEVLRGS